MNGELDRNGYAPSLLDREEGGCFLCGRTNGKLDRHEAFGGAYRQKSKKYGLWCSLCHSECHLNGVHLYAAMGRYVKRQAQKAAMSEYGWTTEEFRKHFGKNFLEE